MGQWRVSPRRDTRARVTRARAIVNKALPAHAFYSVTSAGNAQSKELPRQFRNTSRRPKESAFISREGIARGILLAHPLAVPLFNTTQKFRNFSRTITELVRAAEKGLNDENFLLLRNIYFFALLFFFNIQDRAERERERERERGEE